MLRPLIFAGLLFFAAGATADESTLLYREEFSHYGCIPAGSAIGLLTATALCDRR
jgi:hypothetical protein